MANILLIEPDYRCKQPPLGLMKISYFHKFILHDYVRFAKGKLPEALSCTKWDRVYVTTLFTYEWKVTIEAIEYAKTLVDSIDKITVGGIAATLLPDQFYEATGIHPVCGLLNEPGKLGLPGDECIDQIVPDYSMLDDVDYVYPFHDAYFLSATKGCGNKCGFCAVQTLEPTFVPYIDIKQKIQAIDNEFGPKKDLILMDNNVLRSPRFNDIVDDIIAAGFGKGATYTNPHSGKVVKRYVDFNQGLDALFLNEAKAKRLGEIALKPARVAFDHIEDRDLYERAMRLCAKYGITELSNYVLYNSEDFGGKGKKYHADSPEDLYDRMRITLDLVDDINRNLPIEAERVAAFSFPMRYIPLSAHERGYVGSCWNAKFLRAVQRMLVPTQGKGVCSRSFFEADFGKSSSEFVRTLCMPERLIASRGIISPSSRGKSKETEEEFLNRKKNWERDQLRIAEWNRLYDSLGDERIEFVESIGDNEYLPENLLGLSSNKQKLLYLHYLTTPRLFALLGLIDPKSPTYELIKEYLLNSFPNLFEEMVELLSTSEVQQQYMFKNFASFFGKIGVQSLVVCIQNNNYPIDKVLSKWNATCKLLGIGYVDFELIRVYKRFLELGVVSESDISKAKSAIETLNMVELALVLNHNLSAFREVVLQMIGNENGQKVLQHIVKSISDNIQLRLDYLLED